ncbi:DNA polymerase III subunit delta' [Pelistega europaea]|uniref:DNA polymerase III subunit delta n=1 Tax=Pelistega europaea TaxID=106147 RepID=A0A7Y4LAV9_9BURK|nr:DNA polymerase III subunit delta' [Pelistega europaea]NOL48941.1 DNA polymerase III subunit delta' [Pelistega europaea]
MNSSSITRPTTFFPWQKDIAQQWLSHRERFAHAWLIHGQEGIGKLNFCIAAAKALLCENPQHGLACGHCQSCHWMDLGNHLDYRLVLPDALRETLGLTDEDSSLAESDEDTKLSNEIRIEQVRQLEEFMTVSTLRGGYRLIVMGPAESFNTASSNALLKILEEPAKDTVFLIFTHAQQKVLPTILSRCRRLPLPIPDTEQSLAWLREKGVEHADIWLAASSGAPLKALEQSESPVEPLSYWLGDFVQALAQAQLPDMDDFVGRLEKLPKGDWLRSLQCFIVDLNLCQHGLAPRFFPTLADSYKAIAARSSQVKVSQLNSYLLDQQKLANHPLNAKLFIHATLQRVSLNCVRGA